MSIFAGLLGNPAKVYNFAKEPMYDRWLLVLGLILLALGLVVVYTASISVGEQQYNDSLYFVKRQGMYALMLFFIGLIWLHIPTKILCRFARYRIIILAMILAVLAICIGPSIKGANRWISLGFINFQPAELIKLLWIIYLAGYIERHQDRMNAPANFLKPLLLLLFPVGALIVQKDLGSSVIISGVTLLMLYISGCKITHILSLIGIGIAAVGVLIAITPYRILRLVTFLNPWEHKWGGGYQLTMSLMAYGRGELYGQGLGNSVFKLSYIPDPHTDFVTAVWAEETGLVGIMIILVLEFLLGCRMLCIGFECLRSKVNQNVFQGLVSIGFGFWFLSQTFINIASATGAMPTKGLTLPFISYGGSSILLMMVALVIMLRISYERRLVALKKIRVEKNIRKCMRDGAST